MLFRSGKKDLAEKVAAKGFDTKKNIVKKDSRLAKFAERMAESGFIGADKFRDGVDHTKEMAGAYARAGVQVARDTVDNVKDAIDTGVTAAYTYATDGVEAVKDAIETGKVAAYTYTTDGVKAVKDAVELGKTAAYTYATDGAKAVKETTKREALKFGKATYKGAATAVAIASIPLEAVGKGAVWSVGKLEKGAKSAGKEISELTKSAVESAKTKISDNKKRAGLGIANSFLSFSSAVSGKLSSLSEKAKTYVKENSKEIEAEPEL